MSWQSLDCASWGDVIDDWLDDELDRDAEDRLQDHLDSCDDCRALATDLRSLRRETRDLPASIAPDRDLWPEIARRMARQPVRANDRGWSWGRGLAAVAALVVALFGMWQLGKRSETLEPAITTASRPLPSTAQAVSNASSATPPPLTDPALTATRDAARVLRAEVETRWVELRPATRDVLKRNLDVIDQAIRGIEVALADEPGDPSLETLLLASYQQKISLLERLAKLG